LTLALATAARDLPRGAVLAPGDVRGDGAALVGQELRRPVAAGAALRPGLVAPPRLVRRGMRVAVAAEGAAFALSAEVEALEDGGAGELVRVRSLSSGRVLTARVVADGTLLLLNNPGARP
ncbi:MAG: flagellar basal body P-ring formation protein FlgA, partial [Alphaproteobacteria bacterium]|nr:flagellar basal body P-ring formation protein FlgA [Alphaproteobacteria bacterium]